MLSIKEKNEHYNKSDICVSLDTKTRLKIEKKKPNDS